MHTVVHITPHLGGGVGTVLLNYLDKVKETPYFKHRVLSLEYANDKAVAASKLFGFSLLDKMSAHHDKIMLAIAEADIVLIHWWNHPLLYDLLVREVLPPSRIIFWSHIAGFHAPYVFTKPALYYPDLFVFTSPISLEVPDVINLPDKRQKALRTIWSTGGIEHVSSVNKLPHDGFKVGYIGTVDYSKLHPHFLQMCGKINIPDIEFIVCGGPSEKEIEKDALDHGIKDRFVFTGKINNINKYLSEFDVFGYPLTPYHYGTCEQSLGESMATGIPPVVWQNKAESHVVKDGVNGLVAASEEDYIRAIIELYSNRDLWQTLSRNARKSAEQIYSTDLMINCWENAFSDVLVLPKTKRKWLGKYSGKKVSPHKVFLESIGEYGQAFLPSLENKMDKEKDKSITMLYESSQIWKAKTHGTPQHYSHFFPEDEYLKHWSNLLT